MRAKGNTRHQCGRSAGWTEIRGLGKREMKFLFLSQRMAGLPSGLSEKDLNVQVSFTVTFACESAKERFVSFRFQRVQYRFYSIPPLRVFSRSRLVRLAVNLGTSVTCDCFQSWISPSLSPSVKMSKPHSRRNVSLLKFYFRVSRLNL